MKKIFFVFAGLLFSILLQAQNVGIGIAVPNAKLDIAASNAAAPTNQDGLLVPRVNVFPVSNPAANQNGMLLYLTTTAGANLPGFYYWDNSSTSWKGVGDNKNWGLLGNASSVDGTNFIGTTDNLPFNIRVNNQKAGRIDAVLCLY